MIGNGDDLEHPGDQMIEDMAVKGPVTGFVSGQVKLHTTAGLDIDRVLQRLPVGGRAIDQFEEMPVQMDRVRHHRVVDQLDTHAFIIGKADRVVGDG